MTSARRRVSGPVRVGLMLLVSMMGSGVAVKVAGAHDAFSAFSKPGVCQVAAESNHHKKANGKTEFWGATTESGGGNCLKVRACVYWSWDSGYQSWGGKCAHSARAQAVVIKTAKLWTRYSEHAGVADDPDEPQYQTLGILYH